MSLFISQIEFPADSIIEAAEIISKIKMERRFTINSVEEVVPPIQTIEYSPQKDISLEGIGTEVENGK